MNNADLTKSVVMEDKVIDRTPILREKEREILLIIEAIDAIKASPSWLVLRKYIFDGLVESFDRRLRKEKDQNDFIFIQGQQDMALKFSDFDKFADVYRKELINIRQQING